MADLTQGTLHSLLGLLSDAIKDEARLLGGLRDDVKFIKDEVDSMNGFLLHLTRTETEHDDHLRAWMKQVREAAYFAEDCIENYKLHVGPLPDGLWAHARDGLWAYARRVPVLLRTMPARHRLATKIRQLKVRVRDIGERRLRYDVKIPHGLKQKPAAVEDNKAANEATRAAFLRYLEGDGETGPPTLDKAIRRLPRLIASEAATIRDILKRCNSDRSTTKMFLCALYAYPHGHGAKQELEELKKKTDDRMATEVMIFCYSKLTTHYKSCLQYLYGFHEEKSISRTSLVRRWAAERLVAKEEENQTLEQAAEHCFKELVLRAFVHPSKTGDAGTVKSCEVNNDIWEFVLHMSKTENFVDDLPPHLKKQLEIREIVKRQQLHQKSQDSSHSNAPRAEQDPLDEMVKLLKSLDPLYRLNVLDLGGCTGLSTKRHLMKAICKVLSLKYLSLRNTDVCGRLLKKINSLRYLETLDIRQTKVQGADTEHIFLPKLKHLLAGRVDDSSLSTVLIPRRIGKMEDMEILSHVRVSGGRVELEEVGNLPKLRKLGVDLDIKYLIRAIDRLSERLRSLSIRITKAESRTLTKEEASPPLERLESLNINGALGNDGLSHWIHHMANVSKLTLCETSLPNRSLQTLGKLKGLRCLRLRHGSFVEDSLTFRGAEFQVLKFLLTEEGTTTRIIFEHGAAPELEKIAWWPSTGRMDITSDMVSGTCHLPMLKVAGRWDPSKEEIVPSESIPTAITAKRRPRCWLRR